ncbi:Multimeric flavodoxin WrbA [Clostridium collagenovorans DSM 3089]|uniref:Multimeric flavodoxin WrbA n=1 Tax=Clostridium collagenovorans DSM 3089 TaxID=1121306 RepID=A0A1M5VDV4_9CLOT|nr:flavodoxin family protein [Clostridium collagenovorans]SHH73427.1 Multimeric flavodoxin WrbA [Clostridium collagenovorans DSM 3089]
MKAICIIGSPKSNGSTACIMDTIIEGMKESNIEVRRYVLGDMDINYCKGCMQCYKTKKCIQDDDMNIIIEDLLDADIVLIASPSYWGDVTGQLKVFFDRSTPLSDTNGETLVPKGKIGVSIAVRTGTRVEENIHLINTIEHYYGHLGINPVEGFTVERVQFKEDFKQNAEKVKEALDLGKRLVGFSKNNQE